MYASPWSSAFHAATLATGRALPLTRTGLSPVGTRQLSWRTKGIAWFRSLGRFAAAAAVGLLGVTLIALTRPLIELNPLLILAAVVVVAAELRGIHPLILIAGAIVTGALVSVLV